MVSASPFPHSTRSPKSLLDSVGKRWAGTKYLKGQQALGLGIDCVNWLVVAFREGLGVDIPRRRLPAILGHTAPALAREAMRFLLRHVRPYQRIDLRLEEAQAWDVVVFRSLADGPIHVGICDGAGRMWHATSPVGVCLSPLAANDAAIYRVFRYCPWDKKPSTC